ncbi:MAG: restriction endonuclease subunit S [Crinalium sp.]
MARKFQYPPSVKPGIPKKPHLPEGWYFKSFDDVVEVVERPAQLQDNQEYQLVTAKRSRGGIVPRERLLGEQILTKTQYYTNAGDFLISRRQIIHGACGIVPPELDGAVVSNEYSTLITKPDLLAEYLAYFSHSTYFQQTCFQSSVGVDVEKMIFKLNDWLKYKIPLPHLSEQKKIVEILNSVDEAIASTQAVIDQTRKVKQGLLQQLLTRGIGHTRFKESAIGKIPETWEVVSCEQVCTKITDGEHLTPKFIEEGQPLISAKDIGEFGVDFSDPKYVSEADFVKMQQRCNPESGDVLIVSRGATIGRTGLNVTSRKFALMGSVILAKPDINKITGEYLSYSFQSPQVQTEMLKLSGSSAQQAIYLKDIKHHKLPLPLLEEQRKITIILSTIDEYIKAKTLSILQMQKLKNGLMQDLLTGRVRVGITS